VRNLTERLPWILAGAVLSAVGALVVFAVWSWFDTGTVNWQDGVVPAVIIGILMMILMPNVPKWVR
jgi:hypothetical protein